MYENFGWKWILIAFLAIGSGLAWFFNGLPKGLDLEGGVEIIYSLDGRGKNVDQATTDTVVQILRERIDKLGIKELSINRLGNTQVVIQLPKATDAEVQKIRGQIERAGRLQFKLVNASLTSPTTRETAIQSVLEQKRRGEWDEASAIYDVATYHPSARVSPSAVGGWELLDNALPNGKPLYVDGSLLEDAYRAMDSDGRAAVGFTWNSEGKREFLQLTEKNVGRQLAVVLDGEIRSAPEIKSAIGRRGIIEGGDKGWEEKELNGLIITLKGGALPAKPIFAYQKQVGAQLGRDAVRVGFIAMVAALAGVMLFMAWYYRASGMVANVAMGMNILLILGIMALFEGTLTLPGIAGILLTAGMSVDANILINERVREELAKGTALKQAALAGYQRAFWTIFDANITTLLTAIVLMWAGTGPIKGFGLTLTIGIAASMFTALFVTQTLMGWLIARGVVTQLAYKELFKDPNFDFVARWRKFTTLSLVTLTVGWLVFLGRGEEKFGIDFTGGTQLHMRLKEPMKKDDVEKRIREHLSRPPANLSATDYSLDIQQIGETEGGQERSREWLVRTRRVKSARQKAGDQVSSLFPAPSLFSTAWAQETPPEGGDPAPQGGGDPAPQGGGDPAPAKEGGDAAPADSPSITNPPEVERPADAAPPASPSATPPAAPSEPVVGQPADDREGQFFEAQIRSAFQQELVEPYPRPTQFEPLETGKVKVLVTSNLVGLQRQGGLTGGDIPDPTAEMLRTELPRILAKLAAETGSRPQDQPRKAMYERLGGAEGVAPVLSITEVQLGAGQGVKSFEISAVVDDVLQDRELAEASIKDALEKAVGDERAQFMPAFAFPNVDEIGSAVARNLKQKAFVATIFSLIFICLYVWLRFDFWSGVSAIVALGHDVLAMLGFLTIADFIVSKAGIPFDLKFNLTTISAFLTLVGYSINDTIVILDRIREEKALAKSKTYTDTIVNLALNRTLSRSILTSGTVLITVLVLFFASFAGLGSIQGLSTALVFGTIAGSYSSLFVSAPILIAEKRTVWRMLGTIVGFLLLTFIASYWVVG